MGNSKFVNFDKLDERNKRGATITIYNKKGINQFTIKWLSFKNLKIKIVTNLSN